MDNTSDWSGNSTRLSIGIYGAWRCTIVLLALGLFISAPKPLSAEVIESTKSESKALVVDDHYELPASLYSERPVGTKIDTIVIHYMSAIDVDPKKAYDLDSILGLFKPDALTHRAATSAHYLIERSGKVMRLVPEMKRAWHAGASKMPVPDGRERVNDFSIGIELAMTDKDPPSEEQYESLSRLIFDLKTRHAGLKQDNIVGHDMIRAVWNLAHPKEQAYVKTDPGPLFHWSRVMHRLAELGRQ